MRKIELTEEEFDSLRRFFGRLVGTVDAFNPYHNEDKELIISTLTKIAEALRPPYKPTIAEIITLRELTGVGAWIAKAALVHADGDMNEAARILKNG